MNEGRPGGRSGSADIGFLGGGEWLAGKHGVQADANDDSPVLAAQLALKPFGEGLGARDPDRQTPKCRSASH